MEDENGCGCLILVIALVILMFACSALGFCGEDSARHAQEILGY